MANSDEKKGKKTSGGVRAFFRNLVGMPPIESDLENTPQELKGDIQAQAGESVFVVQSNSELHQMHHSVLDEDSLEVKLKQKKSEKVISVANVLLGGGAVVFNSDYEKELVVKLLQENQLLFKETNGAIKLEQGQTLPTQHDFADKLKGIFVNPGNAADNKSILEATTKDEAKVGAEQPPVAPKTSNVATSSATANQIPVAIPNKPSSTQAERKAGATSDYSRVMNLLNQEIRAKTNLSGEAEELKIHLTNQNSIQRRINGQNLTTDQVLKEIDVYVKFNDDNPNLPQATKVLMLRLALKVKEPLVNPPNPTPDNRSKISDELKARWEQPKSAAAEAKAANKETNPSVSGNTATATTASVADPIAPTRVRRPLVKLQGVNNTASPVNNPNIGRPLPIRSRPAAQHRQPKVVKDPNAPKKAAPENWKKNQAAETANKEANPSVQSPVRKPETAEPVTQSATGNKIEEGLIRLRDSGTTPEEKAAAQKKAASMKGLVQVLLETGISLDANNPNYAEESKKATQLCQAILSDRKTTVVDVLEEVRIQLEKNKDNPQEQVKILARSQFMLNTLMNLNLTDKFKKDVGLDDLRIEIVLGQKELNNNEVKQKFKEIEDMLPQGLKNGFREKLKQNLKQEVFIAPPLEQGEQKLVSVDKLMKKVGKGEQKNFNKSVEQMASDIMVNSTERYLKIKEDDFYEKGWETVGGDNNLRAMDDGINKITHNLVAVSVIKGTNDITEMARRANFWVKVAEKLLEKGDYPSALAIYAVLQSTELPLDVLKSPKFKQTELENLHTQLSSTGNYSGYKKAIVDRKDYIPLTSIGQQEFTFAIEGNPRIDDKENILNTDRLELLQGTLQKVITQTQNENLLRSVREKAAPKFDLAAVFKEPTLTDKEVIAIRIARVEIAEKGSLAAKGGQGSTLGEVYGQLLEVGKRTLEVSTFEGFTADKDRRQDKTKPEVINSTLLNLVKEKLVADKTGNLETYETNRGYAAGIINFVEQYAKKNKVQLNADTNDLIVKLKEEHNLKDVAIPVAVQKGEGVRVQANASVSPTIVTPTVATTVTAQPQPQPQAQQPVAQGFKTATARRDEGQEQPASVIASAARAKAAEDQPVNLAGKSYDEVKKEYIKSMDDLNKHTEYVDYLNGKSDDEKSSTHAQDLEKAQVGLKAAEERYIEIRAHFKGMEQKAAAEKTLDVSATPIPVRPTTAAPNMVPQKPAESSYTFPPLMEQKTPEARDAWVTILATKITKGEELKFSNSKDCSQIVFVLRSLSKTYEGISFEAGNEAKYNVSQLKEGITVDSIKATAGRYLDSAVPKEDKKDTATATVIASQQDVPVASTVIPPTQQTVPVVEGQKNEAKDAGVVQVSEVKAVAKTGQLPTTEEISKKYTQLIAAERKKLADKLGALDPESQRIANEALDQLQSRPRNPSDPTTEGKLFSLANSNEDVFKLLKDFNQEAAKLKTNALFEVKMAEFSGTGVTHAAGLAKLVAIWDARLFNQDISFEDKKKIFVEKYEAQFESKEKFKEASKNLTPEFFEQLGIYVKNANVLVKNETQMSQIFADIILKDTTSNLDATERFIQALPQLKECIQAQEAAFTASVSSYMLPSTVLEAMRFYQKDERGKDLSALDTGGLAIKDVLIFPVQRAPRYALYSKEMNDQLGEKYSSNTRLNEGMVDFIDTIKGVAAAVNEGQRQYEFAQDRKKIEELIKNPEKSITTENAQTFMNMVIQQVFLNPESDFAKKLNKKDFNKAISVAQHKIDNNAEKMPKELNVKLESAEKEQQAAKSALTKAGEKLEKFKEKVDNDPEELKDSKRVAEHKEAEARLKAAEIALKDVQGAIEKIKAVTQKMVVASDVITLDVSLLGDSKNPSQQKATLETIIRSALLSGVNLNSLELVEGVAIPNKVLGPMNYQANNRDSLLASVGTIQITDEMVKDLKLNKHDVAKIYASIEALKEKGATNLDVKLPESLQKLSEKTNRRHAGTFEPQAEPSADVNIDAGIAKNEKKSEKADKKNKKIFSGIQLRDRSNRKTEPLATNAVALDISGPTVVPYFPKPMDTDNADRMRKWASDVVKHYFKIDSPQLPPTITQEKALIAINTQELKLLAEAMVVLKKNGTQFNIPEGSKFEDQLLDFGIKDTRNDLDAAVNIRILLTPNSPTATATATNTNTQPPVVPSVNPTVVVTDATTRPVSVVTPPSVIIPGNRRTLTGAAALLDRAQKAYDEYVGQNPFRKNDAANMKITADISAIQLKPTLTTSDEQKRQALEQLLTNPNPESQAVKAFIIQKLGNDLKVLPQPTQPNNRPLNTLAQRPLPPSSIPPNVGQPVVPNVASNQPAQAQQRPRMEQPRRVGVVRRADEQQSLNRAVADGGNAQPEQPRVASVVTSPSQPPVWSQRHRSPSVAKVFQIEGSHLETLRKPASGAILSDYKIVSNNENSVEFKPTKNALIRMGVGADTNNIPSCVATYTPGIGNNAGGTTSYDMKPGASFQSNESDALLAFLVKKAFDAHLENPATKDKKLVITVLQDMSEPKQEAFVKMVKEEAQRRVNDGILNKDNIEVKKAGEPEPIPLELKSRVNVARK